MEVYRITLARYSERLVASGRAGRWNAKGEQVIYTAGSRALACLESLAHRSGAGQDGDFRVLAIHVPDDLGVEALITGDLEDNWRSLSDFRACQQVGSAWLSSQRTPLLCVPSAIIPEEHNFLLNPLHRDFGRISIREVQPFLYDPRVMR